MNWPWRRRHNPPPANGDVARAEAEGKLRAARRMTEHVQSLAPAVARLPAEEFADRVARAFRGWA